MRNAAALIGVIALFVGLAACASSSSSSTATPSSSSNAAAAKSGTEVAYGKLTGSAAMANDAVFHLTFTGPVSTTGTIPLGGQPKKGASQAFTTAAGNLVITLGSAGTSTGALKSAKTCLFAYTTTVPFAVNGAQSTGKFADATGSGKAVVVSSGELPKLSNGMCNQSQNALPSAKTAAGTFTATTQLALEQQAGGARR
jgi:hypothetical protein